MKSIRKIQADAGRSLAQQEGRNLPAGIEARSERLERARKAGVPGVALFFMVNGRVFAGAKLLFVPNLPLQLLSPQTTFMTRYTSRDSVMRPDGLVPSTASSRLA